MIALLPFIIFVGGGVTKGQYTPVGNPDGPSRSLSANTLFSTIQAQDDIWRIASRFDSMRSSEPKNSFSGSSRIQAFRIGHVRTGLGVQYLDLPEEKYNTDSIAYVKINNQNQRQIGFITLDTGVGKYNSSYARVMFLYGWAFTPTETNIYMFDRPILLEAHADYKKPFLAYGIGSELRLMLPFKGLSVAGSGQYIRTGPKRSWLTPPEYFTLEGQVQYITPIHLGISVAGTHASDQKGFVFINNSISAAVGIAF